MSYCDDNITCDDGLTPEQREQRTIVKTDGGCYAVRTVTDISVTADSINLSVDGLEALVTSSNTKLDTLDTDLKKYSNPSLNGIGVSGCTSDITTTGATDVIAAPGVGLYNYITSILVTNSHASVSTFVNIIEETSGTILATGYAKADGGGFAWSNPHGIKLATANKKVQAQCVTTGANVRVCVTGFKSA